MHRMEENHKAQWDPIPCLPPVFATVANLCAQARFGLDAEEYEDRISRYTKLLADGLPTPLFGCEQPPERTREADRRKEVQCDCCGLIATRSAAGVGARAFDATGRKRKEPKPDKPPTKLKRKRTKRQQAAHRRNLARKRRLALRRAEAERERAEKRARHWETREVGGITESYCRACFDVWGWPDEFEVIRAAVEGVAEILDSHNRREYPLYRACVARSAGV